jgi:predicted metalloprotease
MSIAFTHICGARRVRERGMPALASVCLALALMLATVTPLGARSHLAVPTMASRAVAGPAGSTSGRHVDAMHAPAGAESQFKQQLRQASAEIDAFWQAEYAQMGGTYTSPRFRMFQSGVKSGCGQLASGVGPFYCSLDQTIYVDVPFIKQIAFFHDPFVMRTIFAHEWGHHIQYLSGYDAAVYPNQLGQVFNVQLELDADCLAGVWARSEVDAGKATRDDLRNAMILAYATGDPEGSSLLTPDAHGTSEMRLGAFLSGLDLGRPKACDREMLKLQ